MLILSTGLTFILNIGVVFAVAKLNVKFIKFVSSLSLLVKLIFQMLSIYNSVCIFCVFYILLLLCKIVYSIASKLRDNMKYFDNF